MFRKIIYPPEPNASRQVVKHDCEKRMKTASNTMIFFGSVLLLAVVIRIIDPTLFGTFGTKILGGIFAVMIAQCVNWLVERQRLKKLPRS